MSDQRNAGSPEARIFLGAGDFLAEFRREFAVYGRTVYADFLENAAVHHCRNAPAAGRAAMIGTLPGATDKAARLAIGKPGGLRERIFQAFKGSADIVAQRLEPIARLGLAGIECGAIHFLINSLE
jgi:hypothetical protein